MKLGLQIPDFTWPGGAEKLGPTLATIAKTADEAGFDSIGVMDHFFQIGNLARPSTRCWRRTRLSPSLPRTANGPS